MANIYKNRAKADQTNMGGGYKNSVMFCSADVVTLASPAARGLAGAELSITDDHTFAVDGDGFFQYLTKLHSVTGTTESTGDEGAQSLVHTYSFTILGDDASTLDQMRDILNDNLIWLFKDANCLAGAPLVQLGDECLQATATINFDGKTTKDGLKEYSLKLVVKDKKFFYAGTVTLAA